MPLTETCGIGIRGCLADSLRSDPSVAGGLALGGGGMLGIGESVPRDFGPYGMLDVYGARYR